MKLTSPAFISYNHIPSRYTCDGEDFSPPLVIEDIPEKTRSLALIADDPDAPNGTWVHWLAWNMDPRLSGIPENSVPNGTVEGITSFGKPGWGGPCPPSGVHRYFFKLYALDTELNLGEETTAVDLKNAMNGHILDTAELVGLYSRKEQTS